MKIYISADIEGITGAASFEEVSGESHEYRVLAERMTREVAAACEGAIEGGAETVFVQDAHGKGRNIDADKLPRGVKLIRGWSGHPNLMVQGLDGSFDGVMFIGYHTWGTSAGNPLSHAMDLNLYSITINGVPGSETLIHAWAAAREGVPLILVSGDETVCREAEKLSGDIRTVSTGRGVGESVVSAHPSTVEDKIRKQAAEAVAAMGREEKITPLPLPENFTVDLAWNRHHRAYHASFFPGMEQTGDNTTLFRTEDFFEVMRMFSFIISW